MSPIDDSRDVIVANATITLNNTGDLLTVLARCVSKFREINHNSDEFTNDLLSHLDAYVAAKSAEFFSSLSTIDKINGPQTGDTNNEFSGHSNEHEPQEDAVNELHREFNNQIRQDRLGEKTRISADQHDHEPSVEQTEQSAVTSHLNDASQPIPRAEIERTHTDLGDLPNNENLTVSHDFENGVVRLRPSKNQWSDFGRILQDAKSLAAAGSGICKIVIPEVGMLKETTNSALPCFSHTAQTRENGTVALEVTPSETISSPLQEEGISNLSASTAVSVFERRIKQGSGMQGVQHSAGIRARTENERNRLGLPASPIWPLTGDNLGRTIVRVGGVHWPYAYTTNSSFGAAFEMHQEVWNLYTVSYLYKGSKIWIVVPPSAADLLEQKFRESFATEGLNNCAEFIRHSASYVPLGVLDRWSVPYKIVRQDAGEAVLTFPRTYRQGFSIGSSLAETVNYADYDWSPDSYDACNSRICPEVLISRDMMHVQGTDREQSSAGERESDQEGIDVRQTGDRQAEVVEQQSARRGPRIKIIKKRRAEKEPYKSSKKGRRSSSKGTPSNADNVKMLRRKEASEVLKEVTSRPTIDVGSIYQRLASLQSNSNIVHDDTRVLALMRLFYAIASPDAICQLRDACQSVRQGAFHMTESTENLSSTVRALDRLDASDHVASITRRFYLVALSAKRYEFRTDLSKISDHSRTRVIQETSDAVFGRNDALALTEMMAEAYPQLKPTRFRDTKGKDEYGKKLKTLKERLASGQKWSKLSEEFASGILALVPTQGEYHVSNRDFERLPVDAIDTLVKMLDEFRGDFLRQVSKSVSAYAANFLRGGQYDGRFSFEDADAGVIRVEKYDSSSLIELCKVEVSQPDPIT